MALTRENELLSVKESAHCEGVNVRTMKRWLREGKVTSTKTEGKGRRKGHFEHRIHYAQLSDKAREAFLQDRGLLPEAKAEPKMPGNLKDWQKTTMLKREALIEKYLAAEQDIPPGRKGGFQKHFAKMHGVSPQTLRRHLHDYKEGGREALAPLWTSGGSNRVITKEMEKFIHDDYMRPFGPPARETWEKLRAAFKDKPPLPTYRTVAAYIKKAWPKAHQCLVRDKEAYDRGNAPYVLRSRPKSPNRLWFTDAKQFDIFCWYRGKAVRLWVTVFLDAASGKIVGWAVTLTPDADAIAQAFVRGVREHGRPQTVYMDRGMAYKSHKITGQKNKEELITPPKDSKIDRIAGIFGELGIEVIWAAPHNPREKGSVEATFNYFTSRTRGWPGYCGHNVTVRPRKLAAEIKSGRLLTPEQFSAKIDELIHTRNAREHSSTKKVPNSYYENFTPVIPSENLLAFLLTDVVHKKVRNSAVTIRETMYRHEDMWQLNGEVAEVRRDPGDLRRAAIIHNGKVFCIAPEVQIGDYASPLTKENVKMARRIKRSESQFRKKHIEQGGYIDNPLELAAHLGGKEKEIEVAPRIQKAKVVSLHKKERLAKNVIEGLKEIPSRAGSGERDKIAKISKNDRREQILDAFFGGD